MRSSAIARWVIERQEADGSWGGIQPPWVYSLIALNLMGYTLDHPVMRKGIEGMNRFTIDAAQGWRFQACMSPVWDTAWAVRVLALAGFYASHPAMQRAVRWLLREQIPDDAPGDWRMKCQATREAMAGPSSSITMPIRILTIRRSSRLRCSKAASAQRLHLPSSAHALDARDGFAQRRMGGLRSR